MVLSGQRIENYNELSDQRYFFEVDIQHSEKLHGLQNDLPFLPGKTMENVRKHRDIKLVTTEARRNYLVSKPNYHTTKIFSENSLDIEMKITQIFMNKSVQFGLSILEITKTVMCEFRDDYVKLKYGEKARLYYMDIDSFLI